MHDMVFTGAQIIRLPSVDSTNNYAAKLVKEVRPPEGTVIMTHEQLQGKGQLGNKWLAEPGKNLTFSLILYPKYLDRANVFVISQVTALALSDLLLHHGIDNQVKWPNDIMTAKGKICGVLIENLLSEQGIAHSVVGIGLNVNQHMNYPGIRATSMIGFLEHSLDLDALLAEFCRFFDKWYLLMTAGKIDLIHHSYLLRLLNFGTEATYIYQGQSIKAVIEDVERSGKLKLRENNGEYVYADLKEITFVI